MAITIMPFIVGPTINSKPLLIEDMNKEENENNDKVTYWGIYLDGKQVSFTSSKELAEKTKVWMEKWLTENN